MFNFLKKNIKKKEIINDFIYKIDGEIFISSTYISRYDKMCFTLNEWVKDIDTKEDLIYYFIKFDFPEDIRKQAINLWKEKEEIRHKEIMIYINKTKKIEKEFK